MSEYPDYTVGRLIPAGGLSSGASVPPMFSPPKPKEISIGIKVDTSKIKEATAAMNELTEAAKRAQKAITAISGVLLEGDGG